LTRGALAAGFGITEHSARAMGMAGAFTAVADAPSAIHFNPAGLATLEGLQLEGGVTMIAPQSRYTGTEPKLGLEATVSAPRDLHWVPNLHASWRLHERVAVGLGLTFPYGLGARWPTTVQVGGGERPWWGRDLVQEINLQTMYLTPTVAVQLHPRILVGAGASVVKGAVTLRRALVFSDALEDDVDVKLSGDGWSVAATAGLLVKVLPELLNVGVSFRSGASFTFGGQAAFTRGGSGAAVPASLRTRLIDGPVEAPLQTPHVWSLGVALFPLRSLTVAASAELTGWSSYDQLEIRFTEHEELSTSEPKEWKDTLTARIGAEYRVLPRLPLRVGFIFDQSPVPATTIGPELPDGDRFEVTVGAGYELGLGLSVDLAYQYLTTAEISTADSAPLRGTYRADAHLAAISLGYAYAL
jgi:long-chain fatty acid transport protein